MKSDSAPSDQPQAEPAAPHLDDDGNPNVLAEEESSIRAAIGQPITQTVRDPSGAAIVKPGEIITVDVLEQARTDGVVPELAVAIEDKTSGK